MTQEEIDEFIDSCFAEMEEKQRQLLARYRINTFESYWWDQETSVLQFKNANVVELQFPVVFIGTWAFNDQSWLWGWENRTFLESVRTASERIKTGATHTDHGYFEAKMLQADENRMWELTALAVRSLGALGVYRVPADSHFLMLALMQPADKPQSGS